MPTTVSATCQRPRWIAAVPLTFPLRRGTKTVTCTFPRARLLIVPVMVIFPREQPASAITASSVTHPDFSGDALTFVIRSPATNAGLTLTVNFDFAVVELPPWSLIVTDT